MDQSSYQSLDMAVRSIQLQITSLEKIISMEHKQDFQIYLDSYQYSFSVNHLTCNNHEEALSLPSEPLKKYEKTSIQEENQRPSEPTKLVLERKKRPKYINNCKTKNSLAFFKSAHLKFLEKQGVSVSELPRIKEFSEKVGAAKEDFIEIYEEKELYRTFMDMFKSKYLYRYLMTSRAYEKQKRIFHREIIKMEALFKQITPI